MECSINPRRSLDEFRSFPASERPLYVFFTTSDVLENNIEFLREMEKSTLVQGKSTVRVYYTGEKIQSKMAAVFNLPSLDNWPELSPAKNTHHIIKLTGKLTQDPTSIAEEIISSVNFAKQTPFGLILKYWASIND